MNSGPGQSIKWLQRALGVRVDGVIGEATVQAAEAHPDHDALVAAILERRLAFLKSLRTWRAFGKGWNRRVIEVRQIGQAWASGSVGPQPTYFAGMERRGLLSDAKAAPSPAIADAITGGGIVSTVVDQSVAALSPLQDAMPVVGKVVGVLTAVGGVAAALGLAYRWYATRRSTALADALDLHRDTSPVPAAPANDDVPAPVSITEKAA